MGYEWSRNTSLREVEVEVEVKVEAEKEGI